MKLKKIEYCVEKTEYGCERTHNRNKKCPYYHRVPRPVIASDRVIDDGYDYCERYCTKITESSPECRLVKITEHLREYE